MKVVTHGTGYLNDDKTIILLSILPPLYRGGGVYGVLGHLLQAPQRICYGVYGV